MGDLSINIESLYNGYIYLNDNIESLSNFSSTLGFGVAGTKLPSDSLVQIQKAVVSYKELLEGIKQNLKATIDVFVSSDTAAAALFEMADEYDVDDNFGEVSLADLRGQINDKMKGASKEEKSGLKELLKVIKKENRKEKWDRFFDWDGDGVPGYVEFANSLRDVGDFIKEHDFSLVSTLTGFSPAAALLDVGAKVVEVGGGATRNVLEFADAANDFVNDAIIGAGASVVNVGVSLVEGVATLGEALVDTAAVIGSAATTVPAFIFGGKDCTKELWSNTVEFVGKKHVQGAFDQAYSEDGWLYGLEDASWGIAKRDGGIVYAIGKEVGYQIPIILATAGLSSAVSAPSSLVAKLGSKKAAQFVGASINASLVAAGSFGKNTEKYFGKLDTEGGIELSDVASAVGRSTLNASLDAGVFFLGKYYGGMKVSDLTSKAPDVIKNIIPTQIANSKIGIPIKMTKPLISETVNWSLYDEEFSWRDVGVGMASTYIAEKSGSALKNLSVSSKIVDGKKVSVSAEEYFSNLFGKNAASIAEKLDKIFSGPAPTHGIEDLPLDVEVPNDSSGNGWVNVVENMFSTLGKSLVSRVGKDGAKKIFNEVVNTLGI